MEGGLDKKNVISSDLTLIVLLYVRMNLFLVTAQCSLKGFLVVHVYFSLVSILLFKLQYQTQKNIIRVVIPASHLTQSYNHYHQIPASNSDQIPVYQRY